MNTVDLIIRSATTFYDDMKADENGRYRSWEHCYKCFYDARNESEADYDYLSLQLAFYLASWGMYRGSSFLLQKDYKVHIPAVKEIMEDKYDCLLGIDCCELRKKNVQDSLILLNKSLKDYYAGIRSSVIEEAVKKDISDTLITKILMGTLGCVPAYDRYFVDGVKAEKVTTGNYNLQSLLGLVDFYEANYERFENTRKGLVVYNLQYPQMKLLDMGFWQVGFDRDENKGFKIAH